MLGLSTFPIVAIATAPGKGAVGIIRLSAKSLAAAAQYLCGKPLLPRQATYLPFYGADGGIIDKGLALFFPGPNSYTGEDVLELQIHGGPVVLQLLLQRCLEMQHDEQLLPGLRLAAPGEFTQRAFLNGKIDLAQAEAIADLIDSSTQAAARSAARSLSGEFSAAVAAVLKRLIALRMLVEATLDFPEEDIDFLQRAQAAGQLVGIEQAVSAVFQRARQGAVLREGIKVVIAGQPNAGKSSLLNALAGEDLAIVSPIAGTTRDKVSQLIQIDGVALHVIDTAGLRSSDDEVEKIGIERAWAEIKSADAVLLLHDLSQQSAMNYIAAQADIHWAISQNLAHSRQLVEVWNKADLCQATLPNDHRLLVSAKTGSGLDLLKQRLLRSVGWEALPEGVFMARQRHVDALQRVMLSLAAAKEQLGSSVPALDLLAEDLRQAQRHLSEITGEFSSDDLLGEIFSKFCIGK